MKRTSLITYLWVTLLTLSLAAAACSNAASAPTQVPAKPATSATSAPAAQSATALPALTKEYRLSLATGGTAGTYYPYGGAMAALWSQYVKGVTATAETTGGSQENMRLLSSKQAELAIVQNDVASYGFTGTELFKEKMPNVRAVAALYPDVAQLAAVRSIKTLADVKGKRIVVGPAGSGAEVTTRQILEANGITFGDLGKAVYLSFAEAANAYKDRQIDGFFQTSGIPVSSIQEISTLMEIGLIPLEGETAKNVMDKHQFFVPAKIPSGTYKGTNVDVPSIAVLSMIVTRDDLDADLVYSLTKTLIEKQPELAQRHAKGKELSKESAVTGITVPWHPGAERYYREIGILK